MANDVNLKISSIVQKHDIEANWNKASSFIPAKGQIIVYDVEVDKEGKTLELPSNRTEPITYERFKIGDGIKTVINLPFALEDELEARLHGYNVSGNDVSIAPGHSVTLEGDTVSIRAGEEVGGGIGADISVLNDNAYVYGGKKITLESGHEDTDGKTVLTLTNNDIQGYLEDITFEEPKKSTFKIDYDGFYHNDKKLATKDYVDESIERLEYPSYEDITDTIGEIAVLLELPEIVQKINSKLNITDHVEIDKLSVCDNQIVCNFDGYDKPGLIMLTGDDVSGSNSEDRVQAAFGIICDNGVLKAGKGAIVYPEYLDKTEDIREYSFSFGTIKLDEDGYRYLENGEGEIVATQSDINAALASLNIQNGTTTGIHQIPDNVADGFDFTGKNPNATELDNTLTGTITYGATGDYATSLGGKSAAMGKRSVALGTTTIAKGNYSLATGDNTVTLGNDSFAAGYQTTAKGQASASFGSGTVAEGPASLALGKDTKAQGDYSIAAGYQTLAKDQAAIALGRGVVAENGATVVGRYNVKEPSAIFAVGCGDSDSDRRTAFTVWADGTVYRGSGPNQENSNWVTTRSDLDWYVSDVVKDYWKLPSVPEGFEGGATRVPIQSITNGEISGYGTIQVGKSWAAPETLVQRDEAGNIIVGHPTNDEHAATKAYVDGMVDSIEITNIEDGTTTGIHQIADGVANGFSFVGKNPNAEAYDSSLSTTISYGATGQFAAAFGGKSAAQGKRSMAVGTTTIAKGNYSFACGDNSVAYGPETFAAGYQTLAIGQDAATFGTGTIAKGAASFAIGKDNKTSENATYSFVAGIGNETLTQASAAIGTFLKNSNMNGQVVVGRYNKPLADDVVFAVGSGGNENYRRTGLAVDIEGRLFRDIGNGYEYYPLASEVWIEEPLDGTIENGTQIPCRGISNGTITSHSHLTVGQSWAAPNTLALRTDAGNLIAATPTSNNHVTTKEYVDSKIAEAVAELKSALLNGEW